MKIYHKPLGDMSYQDYINSWMWKDKAELVKHLAGHKCEECGSDKRLQVHHKNYESIGNESRKDLTVLCEKCHKKAHGIKIKKEGEKDGLLR